MPSPLNSIMLDEQAGGLPDWASQGMDQQRQSGLGAVSPQAFDIAIQRLNAAQEVPWNQIDEFRRRWDPEFNAAKQQFDAARMAAQNFNPPINRGLPWLRMAAGLSAPTRTGTPGESFSAGLAGLAGGLGEQQKEEIDAAKFRAEQGLTAAEHGMGYALTGQRSDVQALQAISSLQRARWLMQKQPELMQMYQWANDPSIPPQERAARQHLLTLRYGSALQKNVGDEATSPEMAAQLNRPQWIKAFKQAEQMNPPEAFEGAPLGTREGAVNQAALRIFNAAPTTPVGAPPAAAPTGAPAPVPPPQNLMGMMPTGAGLNAPPPGPAPAAAPVAPPAMGAPAAAAMPPPPQPAESLPPYEGPFKGYLTPPRQQILPQGVVPSTAGKATAKALGAADIQSVQNYLDKEVYPGINVADETRTQATIAKHLLEKNPDLTGAGSGIATTVGNWMMTLGIAPGAVNQFVNNAELFRSQALMQVLAKQLAQKGVQTESDATRMLQAGIDLSKPAEANRFLVRLMDATADRLQERAKFFDAYKQANNGDMRGSVEAWARFNSDNPMVKVIDGKVHFRKSSGGG